MEIWRPVVGWEGFYEVSDIGRVKSIRRKILRVSSLRMGYPSVGLYKNYKQYNKLIHRLVAESFVPLVDGKSYVNHLDGDKLNCHVFNLEWCTPSENNRHACQAGLMPTGQRSYRASLTDAQVRAIKLRLRNGEKGRVIADDYDVSEFLISLIKRGVNWKHVTLDGIHAIQSVTA